jgi:hypothetical protein
MGKDRQLFRAWISAAFLGLLVGAGAITGCERPLSSDSSTPPAMPPASDIPGVVLRADPNPVPPGNPKARTTVIWDTGSDEVGDVYVVTAGNEKLFGSGRQGSQDAPWISAGSTEFRLYTQDGHKLLGRLMVTMPASEDSTNKSAPKP